MKIEKNSALLVIDAQNKYDMHIKIDNGKSINNIEKIIKTFNKKINQYILHNGLDVKKNLIVQENIKKKLFKIN